MWGSVAIGGALLDYNVWFSSIRGDLLDHNVGFSSERNGIVGS
jgi:hypothetical protein